MAKCDVLAININELSSNILSFIGALLPNLKAAQYTAIADLFMPPEYFARVDCDVVNSIATIIEPIQRKKAAQLKYFLAVQVNFTELAPTVLNKKLSRIGKALKISNTTTITSSYDHAKVLSTPNPAETSQKMKDVALKLLQADLQPPPLSMNPFESFVCNAIAEGFSVDSLRASVSMPQAKADKIINTMTKALTNSCKASNTVVLVPPLFNITQIVDDSVVNLKAIAIFDQEDNDGYVHPNLTGVVKFNVFTNDTQDVIDFLGL